MIYAQIKDGLVRNVIVLDDPSIVDLFYVSPLDGSRFDVVERIDHLTPVPQIGWEYQQGHYVNPESKILNR